MNTSNFKRAVGVSICALLTASSLLAFAGCESEEVKTSSSDEVSETSALPVSTADEATAVDVLEELGIDADTLGIEPNIFYDSEHNAGFQLDMPQEGENIAIVHTNVGDITLRLFPEQAPKTVTNFINLAKEGKYDNTTFHRVVRDFIIQGGHCGDDENNVNGTSSYGSNFEDEFCDKLFNLRGAVSMANNGTDSNGSQFFINQTDAETFQAEGGWSKLDSMWNEVKTQFSNYKDSDLLSAFIQKNGNNCYNTDIVPQEVRTLYEQNGGNAYLDGAYNAVDRGHTVFAQVIDGMDVVDKIAVVEVDDENTPVESIIIESVEITEYSSEQTVQNTDE